MKNNDNQPLFAEERQEQILLLLKQKQKLLVTELCDFFQMSPATIRNDLRELADQGKLKRTHGGAMLINKTAYEPSYNDKEVASLDEKKRIANYAASLIEDGDTLALDTGTTMLELAKQLVDKQNLTIILNDIKIASFLEEMANATIIMMGGMLRKGLHCTVGPMTVSALDSLNVDKAFIATNGFSLEKGLTTPDINQAEVKKAMMRSASEIILLCDSGKIGTISFAEFANLHDIDRFITDSNIPPQTEKILREVSSPPELHIV